MTRIAKVETIRVTDFANILFVRLHADDGTTGLGETFVGPETVEAHVHAELAPRLLGRELSCPQQVADELIGYVGYLGSGAETRARSAIDLALWDLFAKQRGMPLGEFLGGTRRSSVRTYNTCAGNDYVRGRMGRLTHENWGHRSRGGRYEDLRASINDPGGLAVDLLSEGITGMKIWPFDVFAERTNGQAISAADLEAGVAPVQRIREAVGDAMEVMVELHALWTVPMAVRIARALEAYGLLWMEDPIRPDDVKGLARIRQATSVPVAAGETVAGLRWYERLVNKGALDVVIMDLGWCGGLTEALRIAGLAATRNLPIAPHDCGGPVALTAATHLCLHVPNAFLQESVRAYMAGWYRELVTAVPTVEAGHIRPPAGPGIGLELQPDLLNRPGVLSRVTTTNGIAEV